MQTKLRELIRSVRAPYSEGGWSRERKLGFELEELNQRLLRRNSEYISSTPPIGIGACLWKLNFNFHN
jgi:hypothetical protein